MEIWQKTLEDILVKILTDAVSEFSTKEIKIIDIGIFPWHNYIELSFLFADDNCDSDDIASWKYYNYSQFNEGKWQEVETVIQELHKDWEKNNDIVTLLKKVAFVVKSNKVNEEIQKFNKASLFKVQILNPDDSNSPNYYV